MHVDGNYGVLCFENLIVPSDTYSVTAAGAAVSLLSNFTCVIELQLDALRQISFVLHAYFSLVT